MRLALVTLLGIGLAAGAAVAQEDGRIAELSRRIAAGAQAVKLEQTSLPSKPRKLGEQILKNILTDGAEERARQDPIFERFDEAAQELAELARDVDDPDADPADERAFIHQFRDVERLALDVERTLTRSGARQAMRTEVKPALSELRRELRSLSASRGDERRDLHRRDRERF